MGRRTALSDAIDEALVLRKREGLTQRALGRAIVDHENERRRDRNQAPWDEARARALATVWEKRLSSWRTGNAAPATEQVLLQAVEVIAPDAPRSRWSQLWQVARAAQALRESPPEPDAAAPLEEAPHLDDQGSDDGTEDGTDDGTDDGTGRDADDPAPRGPRLTRRAAVALLTLGAGGLGAGAWWRASAAADERGPGSGPAGTATRTGGAAGPGHEATTAPAGAQSFSSTLLWTDALAPTLGRTASGAQWASAQVSGLLDHDHLAGFRLRDNGLPEPQGSYVDVLASGTDCQVHLVPLHGEYATAGNAIPAALLPMTGGLLHVAISEDDVVTVTYNGRQALSMRLKGPFPGRSVTPLIWQGTTAVAMKDLRSNAVPPAGAPSSPRP